MDDKNRSNVQHPFHAALMTPTCLRELRNFEHRLSQRRSDDSPAATLIAILLQPTDDGSRKTRWSVVQLAGLLVEHHYFGDVCLDVAPVCKSVGPDDRGKILPYIAVIIRLVIILREALQHRIVNGVIAALERIQSTFRRA